MTWVWTGEVELQRATCKRLGYQLPPIPKNPRDGFLYRQDTDLPHNVLYDWRKLIIVAAGSPTDLNLKFDQLRAYVIDEWGDE
jgi:hypothetical protein